MALIAILNKAKSGAKAFTAEISPPVNYQGMVNTLEIVKILKEMDLKGIAITNSTGGSYRLNPIAVVDDVRQVLPTIPIIVHMTSRDEGSTRVVHEHLHSMAVKNVSDVLVLRGDPTPGNSRFVDSYKFSTVELVRMMSEHIKQQNYAIDLLIAGHPEYPDSTLPKHMEYQKAKIDGGARGIIANIVTDPQRYAKYLEAMSAFKIDVPVIPSVIPLTSARRLEFLESQLHIPVPEDIKAKIASASKEDAVKIGVETSTKIAEQVLKYGAPGINFNVIFRSDAEYVKQILRNLRGYGTIWEKYEVVDPQEKEYYDSLRDRGF